MVLGKSLGAAALGVALVGAGVTAAPGSAKAWWHVGVALPPIVVGPPLVYAPPPPVVYAPPPVAYASPPAAYYVPPPRRYWVPPHWHGGFWIPGHWA